MASTLFLRNICHSLFFWHDSCSYNMGAVKRIHSFKQNMQISLKVNILSIMC